MHAVEFTTELSAQPFVAIPQAVAAQLPKAGHARIIILTPDDTEETAWRHGAFEQFMREDPPEDAVYDTYR